MRRTTSGSLPIPGLRWRGLSLQLFLFISLPITFILLLITIGSLSIHQRGMQVMVGERDERAARTAATALREQYSHRGTAMRGLALRAAESDSYQVVLLTSNYLEPDFDYGLALFTPGGEILASTPGNDFWTMLPNQLTDLLVDAQAHAGDQAVYSAVLHDQADRNSWVYVAAAAERGAPIAVGAFSPATIAQGILTGILTPGAESNAFIVDQDRQLIYHIGDESLTESLINHPGVSDALHGKSGTDYLDVNGGEHVITFNPIPSTGWALVTKEPWESVANPLLNMTLLAPLILVPVLLLTLIALWFGARRIIQPLQNLEVRSAELAWGDYKAIEESVGGIEEISRLQNTLIYLAHKIQHSQAGLHGYIAAITTGQEDERQRLARELHDDTIQSLIALNQQLHLTQMKLDDSPHLTKEIENIQLLTEKTIHDLRRVIRALRPLYLEDLGLVTALQMLTRELQASSGLPIEFEHIGVERRLPPVTELALYRIAQEGLSNIRHHAQASSASLQVNFKPDCVAMTITDDGTGFDLPESPGEFAPSGHYGILGIHERAELIGAQFEIHSEIGVGTTLTVTLPVPTALE